MSLWKKFKQKIGLNESERNVKQLAKTMSEDGLADFFKCPKCGTLLVVERAPYNKPNTPPRCIYCDKSGIPL